MSQYLNTAEKQIKKGIVGLDVIKSNLARHYQIVDEANYYKEIEAERLLKFPEYTDHITYELNGVFTEEEAIESGKLNCDEEERFFVDAECFIEGDGQFTYYEKIDYSDNEEFLDTEAYKNETRIVSEAIEEVVDEEGNITQPYVAEVTELVRPFVPKDNYDEEVDAYLNGTDIYKQTARKKIRAIKDSEDDLTDTKIILQWLAYAVVDMYEVLSDEQKASMAYGNNIAMFSAVLKDPSNQLRVDVETNQLEKIQKIVTDELMFAHIAKTEYLDKV